MLVKFPCGLGLILATTIGCGDGKSSTETEPEVPQSPGPSSPSAEQDSTMPAGETSSSTSSTQSASSGSHSATDGDGSSQESPEPFVAGVTQVGVRCERDARIGGLSVMSGSDRTIVSGSVSNGVMPSAIPMVSAESEECLLLTPRNLFCSSCASEETCAGDDECIAKPVKVSAGTLRVEGLLAPVEVSPNAITLDYSKTVLDPFPAFEVGSTLEFRADGAALPAFRASVVGVAKLSSQQEVVAVTRDQPAALTWDIDGVDTAQSAVYVTFSVNVHGAVTGWIECTVQDDGQFEIPAELVTELVDMGLSGFPRVDIERRSSATVDLDEGCVDVYSGSRVTLDIEVDGLTSCNTDDDCPQGQSCSEQLACE